ncbi:MAG: AI-2E family transporter [Synergistales bacterium]|nr:AI-2E family transporter [Synergistales bacterium]
MDWNATAHHRYRKIFILILFLLVFAAFLLLIRPFLVAVGLAVVLSALFHPVYRKTLTILKGRRAPASGLVLLLAVLVIGLPLLGMLALVTGQAVRLSEFLVPWISEQMAASGGLPQGLPEWVPFASQLKPFEERIVDNIIAFVSASGNYIVQNLSAAMQGTAGFVLNVFITLYATFFFLIFGPDLLERILRYLPLTPEDRNHILDKGLSVTKVILKSILIIGLLQGVLVGAAFWIAGIRGAAFWGAVTLILSAIPGLGAPLVWGPGALYLLLSHRYLAAVAMVLWGGLVVSTVDNILRPRIVGRETQVPDLVVLLSTLGGIAVFGPVGIIFGPVLAGLFLTVLDMYAKAFREELTPPEDAAE